MRIAEYETPNERRKRRQSLLIINISCFIFMMGFSVVLTGMYPYLLKLDSTADKKFLGWVASSFSCAQLVAAPLLGWIGNRLGSIRLLCMITLGFYVIGFVFYSCLGALPEPRKYYMILARVLAGTSSATVALCTSYVSAATTMAERTTGIAILSFSQTAGFVVGPILQTAFSPLGESGISFGAAGLELNMYTAASWLAAIMGFMVMFFFLPCFFKEHNIAKKEAEFIKMNALNKSENGEEKQAESKTDLVAVCLCLFIYSVVSFNFIFAETLATPLAMDLLGMSNKEAVRNVGILLTAAATVCTLSFIVAGFLARKFGDYNVLVYCGLVPVVLANLFYIPYGGPLPRIQNSTFLGEFSSSQLWDETNTTEIFSEKLVAINESATSSGGCPPVQEWCYYIPAPQMWQLVVGFLITFLGYPFTISMSASLYSKLLGSKPQGTWMGLLAAGGSLGRILGPIYVTTIYTIYGPIATFVSVGALMLSVLIITIVYRKKLIIPVVKVAQNQIE